jgi:hypothetical protein
VTKDFPGGLRVDSVRLVVNGKAIPHIFDLILTACIHQETLQSSGRSFVIAHLLHHVFNLGPELT